jgi:hypothetical protein
MISNLGESVVSIFLPLEDLHEIHTSAGYDIAIMVRHSSGRE